MSSNDEEIQISFTGNECETKKRKQVDISSFFGGAAKQKRAEKISSSSKTSQPVTSSRILQAATAEKWKTTKLAKYNAEEWLDIIKDDNTGLVISLKCSICKKFKLKVSKDLIIIGLMMVVDVYFLVLL